MSAVKVHSRACGKNFLFLGYASDSAKREEKIEDLSLLFIHMHHLINEFRPIHARELLQVMLYAQKRRRLQVAKKFRDNLDKVAIFTTRGY